MVTFRQSLCLRSGIPSGECFIPELLLQNGRTFHKRLSHIILSLPTHPVADSVNFLERGC